MGTEDKIRPEPQHAPGLIEAIRRGTPGARFHAGQALLRCGPAAIPALMTALADADPTIRQTAVWALGQIGSSDALVLSRVRELMTDPDPDVCRKAQFAAGLLEQMLGSSS